jgi:1-acyl-sn-glycerol-3-phosphate acyltransferase
MKLFGWHTAGDPSRIAKGVFIAAPHTSNWDLPFTLGTAWSMGIEISWAGKHTLFEFPFETFFRWLGGVPVDRTKRTSFVSRAADMVREAHAMYLIIAPSGTRSRRETWKSGFYHIAREANVPVICGYVDFARKEGGIGPVIEMTGNIRNDMDKIRAFYATITPKHPARWATPRLPEELETFDGMSEAAED